MTTIAAKARYVRFSQGDGKHECHWPGCGRRVAPAKWGCNQHWFKLPMDIRTAIWRAYVPGQEITKRPSPAYIEAAKAAQQWITENTVPLMTQEKLGI